MTERVISIDLQVDQWRIPEARAYRKSVGVNAEYAADSIQQAFVASEAEARAKFGELVDEEGWEPPDGWLPPSLLNIDPDYLLGFAWVPARRTDPALEYEAFAESLPYGELLQAFWDALIAAVQEEVPLAPNREARRKRTPASRTGSRSATTSSGRSKRSTASTSPSGPRPSKS